MKNYLYILFILYSFYSPLPSETGPCLPRPPSDHIYHMSGASEIQAARTFNGKSSIISNIPSVSNTPGMVVFWALNRTLIDWSPYPGPPMMWQVSRCHMEVRGFGLYWDWDNITGTCDTRGLWTHWVWMIFKKKKMSLDQISVLDY